MKRYNEMEESELLSLTDDQVSLLIDYECAVEGIPMLPPHPGPAPVKVAPAFDAKAFEVGGVLVLDAEHAGRILDAITSGPIYKMEYGSDHLKPIKENDYGFPELKTKSAHSLEQWGRIASDVKSFEDAKKAYDRCAKLYNDTAKERQGIVDAVYDAIRDARNRACTRDTLRSEFAHYLKLAEGNNSIAYNFLDKAKGHILADFPELREEFCPPTCADASPLTDLRAEDVGEVVL